MGWCGVVWCGESQVKCEVWLGEIWSGERGVKLEIKLEIKLRVESTVWKSISGLAPTYLCLIVMLFQKSPRPLLLVERVRQRRVFLPLGILRRLQHRRRRVPLLLRGQEEPRLPRRQHLRRVGPISDLRGGALHECFAAERRGVAGGGARLREAA